MRSTPGDLRRHRAHHECRDERPRNVDPDRVERHPAPLELDARLDLEPDVGRPLLPRASGGRGLRARARRSRENRRAGVARAGSTPSRRSAQSRTRSSPRERTSSTISATPLMPSIRSSGTSRIDDAPAASSAGSSRQTSCAGMTLCTATMPGSASGSTLGAREPGTSAQIASSASSGAFSIRYRAPRASTTLRKTPASCCDSSRGSRGPMSTASDSSRRADASAGRSCGACCRSRRGRRSRRRGRGAARARRSRCTSTSSTPGSSSRASRGKLVATRAPRRSSSDLHGRLGRHRSLERARAEAEPHELGDVGAALAHDVEAGDAAVDDAVLHVLGDVVGAHEQRLDRRVAAREGERAVARRLGAEPGVVRGARSRARGAAPSRERRFSGARPACAVAAPASSRPRRSGATAPPASPSSSRRAPAAPPPGTAAPRPAAAPPASGAPSRPAPTSCRGRAGSAPPRPRSGARRSPAKSSRCSFVGQCRGLRCA